MVRSFVPFQVPASGRQVVPTATHRIPPAQRPGLLLLESIDTNVGRWRVIRSTAFVSAAVAVLGLLLGWMGGGLRDRVYPGVIPVERVDSTGRTLVPVERVRAEDTTVVVGSIQPKRKATVASQVLA